MAKRTPEFLESARQCSAQHASSQRRQGLKRVSVWVPEGDTERLKDIAAALRTEAGKPLPDDGSPRPRAVQVPIVEPRYPDPERVWIQVGPDELGTHMLLKANGGVWHGQKQLWSVRAHLPAQLGLLGRVRGSA